jgi:glutamate-1-semialdehyde 2,1-aminomutase
VKAISGLGEVSFHMSGTEAVMAAVRLARFNTRRRLIVSFAGAYHG